MLIKIVNKWKMVYLRGNDKLKIYNLFIEQFKIFKIDLLLFFCMTNGFDDMII